MPTYAIGDLQGCFAELQDLLDTIQFDSAKDRLLFTGDLVNRGPESQACLRFVMEHADCARTVLGNHDLHLLAVALDICPPARKDTFDTVFDSPDRDKLLHWVRHQPLMINDTETGYCLVHAGLFPEWTVEHALEFAVEVESTLQGDEHAEFLGVMYGNAPGQWSDSLTGFDRRRCIINAMTRMRYLGKNGNMNYSEKGAPGTQPENLVPWYRYPDRKSSNRKILFGHWSTIYLGNEKNFRRFNVFPLDTGCLWGGKLTALRLDDETWFSVPSRQKSVL